MEVMHPLKLIFNEVSLLYKLIWPSSIMNNFFKSTQMDEV